jgi:purine-nucleoside phosphorylase
MNTEVSHKQEKYGLYRKIKSDLPKITPEKLLGKRFLPVACKTAFICYCPMPPIFEKYDVNIRLEGRYFIHSHNSHVKICNYNNINFIVIAEVYGGPVSVTTVEELKYYGIQQIIGIGFVGALKPQFNVGNSIVAEKALIEMGTTPHYHNINLFISKDLYVEPSMKLGLSNVQNVCVWTTNTLYREYSAEIIMALTMGCSVVNMDTSHLYAACKMLNIACEYYATVSDIIEISEHLDPHDPHDFDDILLESKTSWNNSLTEAVNNGESIVIKQQTLLITMILGKLLN